METDDTSPFDEHASVVSPRVITTVVLCVFVVGMSVDALVSDDNLGFFSSEEPSFTADFAT